MPTCHVCNKPFPQRPWPVTKLKFCSPQCRQSDWRDRHRERLRESNKLYVRKHRANRLKATRKYSASEKGRATKQAWYESNYGKILNRMLAKYHSDPELRQFVLSRARANRKLRASTRLYSCIQCGVTEKLHAHHKDKNPMNNKLINLEWLCPPCHRKEHRGE